MKKFSIICCSNDLAVLNKNLLSNYDVFNHDLIVKFFPKNICAAYNAAAAIAQGDYLIFVHQDICLPESFFADLSESIDKMSSMIWGIAGAAGRDCEGVYWGWCNDRGDLWGSPKDLPKEVQTLDEMILIVPKDVFKLVRFDENIKNQHLFGTDLCLQISAHGLPSYAINCFCFHNSKMSYTIGKDFFDTASYLRKKWNYRLPIYSTCAVID